MLEGININLRVIDKEDINLYQQWINTSEILGRYNRLRQVSTENLQGIFSLSPDDFQAFIIEKKDNKKIGVILYFINKGGPYELLEIGYFLIPPERNKGYCSEAVKIFVDYLFLSKDIVRIQAATVTKNIGSQKVLEKAGFTKEGIIRKMMWCRGDWRDYILYSILRDEWKEPRILKIKY